MMPIFAVILQTAARPSILPFIIQFVAIIGIFWFLLIRPQQKKSQQHQQVLSALKAGDEVVTDGGIIGTVIHIKEDRVTIKTGETRIVVIRSKIGRVTTASAETAARIDKANSAGSADA
jgi:preprotein translocase subunit YajC